MTETWIAPFAQNQTCYDTQAKEIVKISNGVCTLDHSSAEAFRVSHPNNGPCRYAPCEAVALRVVGVTKTGDPIVGMTYRKVDPAYLTPVVEGSMVDVTTIRRSRFAGRV